MAVLLKQENRVPEVDTLPPALVQGLIAIYRRGFIAWDICEVKPEYEWSWFTWLESKKGKRSHFAFIKPRANGDVEVYIKEL